MKQILPKDITPFELQSVLQHAVAPRPIAFCQVGGFEVPSLTNDCVSFQVPIY